MKKRRLFISSVILSSILLMGCGGKSIDMDTSKMTINDDFSIKSEIVDDFDESLYDSAELAAMMDKEASEFNATYGAGLVTTGEVVTQDGRVKASMNFASDESYAQFNSRFCKLMSLDEANSSGSLAVAFRSVKDNEVTDINSLKKSDQLYVLITDEIGVVECPGKVMYISDGVETMTKTSVSVTEGMDGLAYIIFINK